MPPTEYMSRYIYGINQKCEVVTIAAYIKGKSVRLSGPNGSQPVHPSSARDVEDGNVKLALYGALSSRATMPLAPGLASLKIRSCASPAGGQRPPGSNLSE